MNVSILFVPSLVVLSVLAAASFLSGRRGWRVTHLALVAATIVGVGLIPLFTALLATLLRFPAWPATIFRCGGAGVVALLIPMAISGAGILGGRRTRPLHARVARWLLPWVLATALVGAWMYVGAS